MTSVSPVPQGAVALADIEKALKLALEQHIGDFKDDPLGFVLHYFDWPEGEGPDEWQRQFLEDLGKKLKSRTFNGRDPVEPIRMAVASGHDIGKSALMAWIHWFVVLTRPHSKGTITANTFPQLETKTWPEVHKWYKRLLVFQNRFTLTDRTCVENAHRKSWFTSIQTCERENSEAFAGQHNRESTSFYIFDEASLIPDEIFEVANEGLKDGEPMMFVFGNPTRNVGEFYEICFGNRKHRWNQRSIDARTCKLPNKAEQQKEIEDYGIDSDRVRTRILGLPPRQSEFQLISRATVEEAQKRMVSVLQDDPLVAGVDVPDGGSAWFIVRFRRGLSARPGPAVPDPVRVAGSQINRDLMVSKLAQILSEREPAKRVAMMFVDAGFGAAIVERLHALGFRNVQEVSFGAKSPDPHYGNFRAWMWAGQMREWLSRGAIDAADKKLAVDLTSPGFHHRVGGDGALMVESKDEMAHPPKGSGKTPRPSPDDGDALALTFACPVAPPRPIHRDINPSARFLGNSDDRRGSWMG